MSSEWSSDWYKDRFSDDARGYSPCMYRHVVIETMGARRFIQGEVVDDLRDHLLCLDCLEILDEKEVLSAWHGEAQFVNILEMEEDYGDN